MKRFLSVLSLLIGLTALAAGVAAMLSPAGRGLTGGHFSAVNGIAVAVGVLFFALGIWGNVRLSRKAGDPQARARQKKKDRAVLAVSAVLLLAAVGTAALLYTRSQKSSAQYSRQIAESLRIDPAAPASGTAPMPANARYILYDLNRRLFTFAPDTGKLQRATGKPDEANVLVRYRITSEKIGVFRAANNAEIANAYAETIRLEVIDMRTWGLIAETTVNAPRTEAYLREHTYTIGPDSEAVVSWLNRQFAA